mgnify:CR=1 FL=1
MTTIAIVGGGLAGAKAAEALREHDFDGDVVLIMGAGSIGGVPGPKEVSSVGP